MSRGIHHKLSTLVPAILLAAGFATAQVQWTTSVNGQPWTSGMEIDVEFGDAVQIDDTFTNTGAGTVVVALNQSFVTTEVTYLGHNATGGTVTQPAGQVLWSVSVGSGQSATLTVWYFTAQCNWPSSTIQRLWVGPAEHRDVTLDKWLHDLSIDSSFETLVFSGQPASFHFDGGNGGGYENDVQVWCSFSPDAPFGGSTPSADYVSPDSLTANWELGDLANGTVGSVDVTIEVAPGLPNGTPTPSLCSIQDHTGALVETTNITQITAVTTEWATTVDAVPWQPGLSTVVELGDTVEVVEELHNRSGATVDTGLTQSYQPSELLLVDVTVSQGMVDEAPGFTEWTADIGAGQTATMISLYSVEPCTWTESIMSSILAESGEVRETLVEKTPADLHIDSSYEPMVVPGEPAPVAIGYGNSGGYENDVVVWCNFPPEAPFGESTPLPDFVDPSLLATRWDLGDLAGGTTSGIDLTADVQDGLPPGASLELFCTIQDHTGSQADDTVIALETIDALAIFEDGFESGDTTRWSEVFP